MSSQNWRELFERGFYQTTDIILRLGLIYPNVESTLVALAATLVASAFDIPPSDPFNLLRAFLHFLQAWR